MMQLLLTKASELPALLERFHNMGDLSKTSEFASVEQLWKDFQTILSRLGEWELTLHSQESSPSLWWRHTPKNSSHPDASVLWFPNIMTASCLTQSWAFEIIIRKHLRLLGKAIATTTGSAQQPCMHNLTESFSKKRIVALAEMICDSMPYLMQPEMKLYGPGSAFFAFTTAVQVFQSEREQYSVRLGRCQRIVDRLTKIGIHFPHT
jgi:hypothetical protein